MIAHDLHFGFVRRDARLGLLRAVCGLLPRLLQSGACAIRFVQLFGQVADPALGIVDFAQCFLCLAGSIGQRNTLIF